MRNAKFFSCLCAMVLAVVSFAFPGAANAGNWSINIGVPVVAAASAPPVAPIVTVIPSVPVVSPYVSGHVVKRYPARHYYGVRYYPRHGYRHGHH